MNALIFAWRSLVRQPARAILGILGIAAVGALLFDMLLLSNGLVLSMQDLLERTGFDIRVSAGSSAPPWNGPDIPDATAIAAALAALPEVDAVVPIRSGYGGIPRTGERLPVSVSVMGAETAGRRVWTVVEGRDLSRDHHDGEALLNRNLANRLKQRPGDSLELHGHCTAGPSAVPAVTLRIAGVAEFPFETAGEMTLAASLRDFDRACGGTGRDIADQLLVAFSAGSGVEAASAAIERRRPDLQAMTNEQVVARLQQGGLSYFRQISIVLVTVTVSFAFLLVTVLLTVAVNQRLGEIAALRALGFSQRRVVADVLCESALLVGSGAALALPLGLALARGLDWILKAIPGMPSDLHFFVYQPRAVVIHVALFAVTALLAAAYPMRMVARLPIAATLRKEVVS